jgi:uncharacterized protein (TIGR02996 family)
VAPSSVRFSVLFALAMFCVTVICTSATGRQVNGDPPGALRAARAVEAGPPSISIDPPKLLDIGKLQRDLGRTHAQFETSLGSFPIPRKGEALFFGVWFAMVWATALWSRRVEAAIDQAEARNLARVGHDDQRANRRDLSARLPNGGGVRLDHSGGRAGRETGGANSSARAEGEGRAVPIQEVGARIPVPASWGGAQGATFRSGANGLWLQFNQDAEVAYTTYRHLLNEQATQDAFRIDLEPVVLRVQAGQRLRVVDHRLPDDGLGHEPTVRADFAEICVSPPGAAQVVQVIPGYEAMRRVFNRSADDVGFWFALAAAPDDALPRLVYADWLDERGDPAGAILRGIVLLRLHYSVGVGHQWEHRNQRRVDWQQTATELASFLFPGASPFLPEPRYERISLIRFAPRPNPQSTAGEWQAICLTLDSNKPVPPFVNYLLIQSASALLIRRHQTAANASGTGPVETVRGPAQNDPTAIDCPECMHWARTEDEWDTDHHPRCPVLARRGRMRPRSLFTSPTAQPHAHN